MTNPSPSRPLSLLPTTRHGLKVVGLVTLVALSAAGCFQPSGSILEKTSVAQGAPTYTPPPTETPTDIPQPTITPSPEEPTITNTPAETELPTVTPTETMVEDVLALPTTTPSPEAVAMLATPTPSAPLPPGVLPTAIILPPYTEVAFLQIDPLIATATALALQLGGQIEPPPLNPNAFDIGVQGDPIYGTATAIIQTATAQIAIPQTQTAEALLGGGDIFIPPTIDMIPGATATFDFAVPTAGTIFGGSDCIYEVQNTDRNLFRIALAYGVTVDDIARASGIVNPNLIYFGQRLVIPGCGTTGLRPPPTSVGVPDQNGGGTGSGGGAIYIVQQNDTLFQLSLQYGVTVNAIAATNGISNINLIFIGQQLVIP